MNLPLCPPCSKRASATHAQVDAAVERVAPGEQLFARQDLVGALEEGDQQLRFRQAERVLLALRRDQPVGGALEAPADEVGDARRLGVGGRFGLVAQDTAHAGDEFARLEGLDT